MSEAMLYYVLVCSLRMQTAQEGEEAGAAEPQEEGAAVGLG